MDRSREWGCIAVVPRGGLGDEIQVRPLSLLPGPLGYEVGQMLSDNILDGWPDEPGHSICPLQ